MIEALNYSIAGLQKSSLQVAKAADNIANVQRGTEPLEDIIDVKVGEQNFAANAQVFKTTQDLQDTLLRALDIEV